MSSSPTRITFGPVGSNAQERLEFVVDMMRDMSRQTDPQKLVLAYASRMRKIIQNDGFVSLSRRDLRSPNYRITRSTKWGDDHNPWKRDVRLPVFDTGLLGDLIYGEEPVVINDFTADPNDPAFEHLEKARSLVAIPNYDGGEARHMTVLLHNSPNAFDEENLPQHVWMSNMFGRATSNLVLSAQVQEAYEQSERELRVVADIQRSLLPSELPKIPGLDLAAHYQTSRLSGGDYYDFFPLPGGKWGILIADVSGHGTPAAVIMAVTHSIAHTIHENPEPPSKLMNFVNRHLTERYTGGGGTFVTAFYGVYDPANRKLTYARAGHPPPRVLRCEGHCVEELVVAEGLPLGILDDADGFTDATIQLRKDDVLVFYTDGITEARSPGGDLFGTERLDQAIDSSDCDVESIIRTILLRIEDFTNDAPPNDDVTLMVARVT